MSGLGDDAFIPRPSWAADCPSEFLSELACDLCMSRDVLHRRSKPSASPSRMRSLATMLKSGPYAKIKSVIVYCIFQVRQKNISLVRIVFRLLIWECFALLGPRASIIGLNCARNGNSEAGNGVDCLRQKKQRVMTVTSHFPSFLPVFDLVTGATSNHRRSRSKETVIILNRQSSIP
jgi:hypothetical protein